MGASPGSCSRFPPGGAAISVLERRVGRKSWQLVLWGRERKYCFPSRRVNSKAQLPLTQLSERAALRVTWRPTILKSAWRGRKRHFMGRLTFEQYAAVPKSLRDRTLVRPHNTLVSEIASGVYSCTGGDAQSPLSRLRAPHPARKRQVSTTVASSSLPFVDGGGGTKALDQVRVPRIGGLREGARNGQARRKQMRCVCHSKLPRCRVAFHQLGLVCLPV